MFKILFYFGSRQLNPLWLALIVVALLLMALAQSYASAKKMRLGPALLLSMVFLIVGLSITYFIYDMKFAAKYPPDYTFEHISIYSYGFMLMLSFVIGTIWLIYQGKRDKPPVEADSILDLMVFIIIGSIIGARAIYVLTSWENYAGHEEDALRITEGGLSIHGGIIGGMIFGWFYSRIKGLDYWGMADLTIPALALGQFIGRIGCYLNGCCFGRECSENFILKVKFPNAEYWLDHGKSPELARLMDSGQAAMGQIWRHPVQLYEAFGCLLIFFYLLSFRKNKVFKGHVFLMYVWLYSVLRFIVENFRYMSKDDPATGSSVMLWHFITMAQLACIVFAILAFFLMQDLKRRSLLAKMIIEKKAKDAAEMTAEPSDAEIEYEEEEMDLGEEEESEEIYEDDEDEEHINE